MAMVLKYRESLIISIGTQYLIHYPNTFVYLVICLIKEVCFSWEEKIVKFVGKSRVQIYRTLSYKHCQLTKTIKDFFFSLRKKNSITCISKPFKTTDFSDKFLFRFLQTKFF